MMENRNIRLLFSLAVLTVITAGVYWSQTGNAKVFVDPAMFRIADASAIDHVVIESKKEKIDLRFNGTRWNVNEKYAADRKLIEVLMATMLQVTPKRPIPKQQLDSVKHQLDSTGVKVSLSTAAGLLKQFTAGGNAAKTQAYFKNDEDGTVWVMAIPGYRVYASGIFEINQYQWRDKRIFNFNWRDFKKLVMTYPGEPAADFEIARQGDFLGVVGFDKQDSTKINGFLNDILSLQADEIIAPGTSHRYDSIAKTKPMMTIHIEDIANRSYALEIYAPSGKGSQIEGLALGHEIVLFDQKKGYSLFQKKGYFKVK